MRSGLGMLKAGEFSDEAFSGKAVKAVSETARSQPVAKKNPILSRRDFFLLAGLESSFSSKGKEVTLKLLPLIVGRQWTYLKPVMASEVHKVAGSRHFEGPDYLMYVRDPDKAPITQFVAGASLFARHSQTNNARQRHMDLRVENSTFIGGAAWFCLDPIIQPRPNRSWSVPAVINLKMGVEFGHHQERYYFPGPAVPEKSSGIWGGLYFSGNF